jgi:hypothetical protein
MRWSSSQPTSSKVNTTTCIAQLHHCMAGASQHKTKTSRTFPKAGQVFLEHRPSLGGRCGTSIPASPVASIADNIDDRAPVPPNKNRLLTGSLFFGVLSSLPSGLSVELENLHILLVPNPYPLKHFQTIYRQ